MRSVNQIRCFRSVVTKEGNSFKPLLLLCLSYFPKVTSIDQKKIELKRLLMNQTLPRKVFSFFKKLELHLLGIKIFKLFCQLLAYAIRQSKLFDFSSVCVLCKINKNQLKTMTMNPLMFELGLKLERQDCEALNTSSALILQKVIVRKIGQLNWDNNSLSKKKIMRISELLARLARFLSIADRTSPLLKGWLQLS